MELFQAIEERFSYRGAFLPQTPPEEDLRRIVQAGLDAPSGKNLQTSRFVIVNDPLQICRIRSVLPESPYIATAPTFIALFCSARVYPTSELPLRFEIEDAAAATENMLLSITALGYASVWLDGMLRSEGRAEQLGEILGIPDNMKVRVLLPVGRPAEEYSRREKLPFHERVRFNSWNSD